MIVRTALLAFFRELVLLVEAGLSPVQARAAATTAAGDLLGRDWGLYVGDDGSVVLLDASPIDSIANTQRIHAVIHHGVLQESRAFASASP